LKRKINNKEGGEREKRKQKNCGVLKEKSRREQGGPTVVAAGSAKELKT